MISIELLFLPSFPILRTTFTPHLTYLPESRENAISNFTIRAWVNTKISRQRENLFLENSIAARESYLRSNENFRTDTRRLFISIPLYNLIFFFFYFFFNRDNSATVNKCVLKLLMFVILRIYTFESKGSKLRKVVNF